MQFQARIYLHCSRHISEQYCMIVFTIQTELQLLGCTTSFFFAFFPSQLKILTRPKVLENLLFYYKLHLLWLTSPNLKSLNSLNILKCLI